MPKATCSFHWTRHGDALQSTFSAHFFQELLKAIVVVWNGSLTHLLQKAMKCYGQRFGGAMKEWVFT